MEREAQKRIEALEEDFKLVRIGFENAARGVTKAVVDVKKLRNRVEELETETKNLRSRLLAMKKRDGVEPMRIFMNESKLTRAVAVYLERFKQAFPKSSPPGVEKIEKKIARMCKEYGSGHVVECIHKFFESDDPSFRATNYSVDSLALGLKMISKDIVRPKRVVKRRPADHLIAGGETNESGMVFRGESAQGKGQETRADHR